MVNAKGYFLTHALISQLPYDPNNYCTLPVYKRNCNNLAHFIFDGRCYCKRHAAELLMMHVIEKLYHEL